MQPQRLKIYKTTGLSLIELMVSIAIGSLLMLGLVSSFRNSSNSQRELEKSGQLIENGRYAIELIAEDVKHAGFYGHYYKLGNPPAALPDPCETDDKDNLEAAVTMPMQGYTPANLSSEPDISATTCDDKGLLTSDNLTNGSDILVIRRADTVEFNSVPTDKEVYFQGNGREFKIMFGKSSAGTVDQDVVASKTADDENQDMKMYPSHASKTTWAATRKFHVHVYFVTPCAYGTGTNDVCQSGDDNIPTLKRLDLSSDGSNTIMDIVPLVEGIEYLKFKYGIDNSPASVNTVTGLAGDGIPDTYVDTPTAAQWPFVVSVRIYLLARALDKSRGYTDSKSYVLGTTNIAAAGDEYKRHVYGAEVRPVNMAGRREIPE